MASCTYNCFMNVINIGNSIIGVSILAMPYCFRKCGILLSLVLIIISGLLTKLACFLILKSAVMARRRSFEYLAFHIFGSYGKLVVEISVIGFLIGVCIAFFVVIGDLGPPLAAEFLAIENAPNLRTNVLMLVGLCVALPLGLLRKIDSLTSLSALSIGFYIFLILKIFAEAIPNLSENEWWFEVNWWQSEGILPCLPIFSMALSCQTQLFEFFDTANEPSLKRMQSVIDGAVCLCSAVYVMVGMFGYIAFHDKNITGNILIFLTPSIVTEFIKLGFILTVAVSFPLCLFPCRSSLHSLLFKPGFVHHELNVHTIPDHRFRILTISLVIVTIGIAIMLPNIEFVLGIIGSTIGTIICLILPAAIFIYDSNKMTSERRKAQMLFGVGVFILIACTFSTLHENNNRDNIVLQETSKVEKITPAPLLIISSLAPVIVQSPKVMIKEQPIIQINKKLEISETKAEDQKRLEPPIPQEPDVKLPLQPEVKVPSELEVKIPSKPEVKISKEPAVEVKKETEPKVEQNADLDPQALQKEDKELLKDSHLPVNSQSFKKDDGLDKQEKVLKKLEQQQEQQKLILEQQQKILEELKQHKESHEVEIKRNELLEKQKVSQNDKVAPAAKVVDQKIDLQPVPKHEVVKNVPIFEKGVNIEKDKGEVELDKKTEFKPRNISLDIPKPEKSQILDGGVQMKLIEHEKIDENIYQQQQIDSRKTIDNENILIQQQINSKKSNISSVLKKPSLQNMKKNLSDAIISKGNQRHIVSNLSLPSQRDGKLNVPEEVKNNEMHVKNRETLAKKDDFEVTASLPKEDMGINIDVKNGKM